MKTKKNNQKDKLVSKVEEPIATYGTTAANSNDAVISNLASEYMDENPKECDALYNQLKAEADALFGVKKRMTVDEYFGKLRYMVNAYYDNVQD